MYKTKKNHKAAGFTPLFSTFWAVAALLTFFPSGFHAQTPSWYIKVVGLKPLATSRAQVEALFDTAAQTPDGFVQDGIETAFYSDSNGRFTTQYGTGTLVEINGKRIEIGKGILIGIIYFPKEKTIYKDLRIDHKKFSKFWDGHDPAVHYLNESLGVDHAVSDKRLVYVLIRPPK